MRRSLIILLSILSLTSCAMPVTTVRSVDSRPSISMSGANDMADLFVDGLKVGRAADFTEPNQLKLEAGTHKISLVEAGMKTFEQTIFVESEHKTIFVK